MKLISKQRIKRKLQRGKTKLLRMIYLIKKNKIIKQEKPLLIKQEKPLLIKEEKPLLIKKRKRIQLKKKN